MPEIDSPWMTAEEVREYLGGIHKDTLTRYRSKGLPVHYLGDGERTPRYHREEVDAWVLSRPKGGARKEG